jgi:hypothetical protein
MRLIRKFSAAFAVLLAFAIGFMPQTSQAGAASSYLIGKFYGTTLQGTAFTPPATVYVALATGTFTAQACTSEVSGGSYARVAVTANTSNWTVASGVVSNAATITFPAPTASWGTVNQFCVYDAATGGNLLISAQLTTAQTISSGQSSPSFAAAALTWTIS